MKSRVSLKATAPLSYPFLGVHHYRNQVVLFCRPNCGVVVFNAGSNVFGKLGYYREDWIMDKFTPVVEGSTVVLTQ